MNDLTAFDADGERDRQICDLRVKGKTEAGLCHVLSVTVPDIHRASDRAAQAAMTPQARVRGIYIDAARLERVQQNPSAWITSAGMTRSSLATTARRTEQRSRKPSDSSSRLLGIWAEQTRAAREGLSEDELALFDLLKKEGLSKADRERVKQANRDLLASIKAQLAQLDRFWEKEQTKGDVEASILDRIFIEPPTPPFTLDEKTTAAKSVFDHIWQQAMRGVFATAT
jgi:hypothetical protein